MSTLQATILWWTIAIAPILAWYLSLAKFGRSGMIPALTGLTLCPVVAIVWYNFSEFGDSLAPGLVGIIGTVVLALLGYALKNRWKIGRLLMHFSLVWALVGWRIWNAVAWAATTMGTGFVVVVVVAIMLVIAVVITRAVTKSKQKPPEAAKKPSKAQPTEAETAAA